MPVHHQVVEVVVEEVEDVLVSKEEQQEVGEKEEQEWPGGCVGSQQGQWLVLWVKLCLE
jgi:hypothetical protein